MGNQQPSLEQRKVQRPSQKRVGVQAIGIPKRQAPLWGEDMVYTLSKDRERKLIRGSARIALLVKQIGERVYH